MLSTEKETSHYVPKSKGTTSCINMPALSPTSCNSSKRSTIISSGKNTTPIEHWLRQMHTDYLNHTSSIMHLPRQEFPPPSSMKESLTSPMGGKLA